MQVPTELRTWLKNNTFPDGEAIFARATSGDVVAKYFVEFLLVL